MSESMSVFIHNTVYMTGEFDHLSSVEVVLNISAAVMFLIGLCLLRLDIVIISVRRFAGPSMKSVK